MFLTVYCLLVLFCPNTLYKQDIAHNVSHIACTISSNKYIARIYCFDGLRGNASREFVGVLMHGERTPVLSIPLCSASGISFLLPCTSLNLQLSITLKLLNAGYRCATWPRYLEEDLAIIINSRPHLLSRPL